jgi:hypothetical protein
MLADLGRSLMEAGFAPGSQIQFGGAMSAQIYQLRDFQNPKDIERLRQALEREAQEIMSQIPYGGAGIDGMPYYSPEKDPA